MNFKLLAPLALIASCSLASAIDIFVAPNGNDNNSGTQSEPLRTLEGARNKVRTLSKNQNIRVRFRAGTYRFSRAVAFGSADSGTNSKPIVYESFPGETAFFDGGRVINTGAFRKVSGGIANRIPSSARSSVWSQVISDTTTRKLLSNAQNGLSFNGNLFRPTQSPNSGFYNISREFSNGAFRLHENTNYAQLKAEIARNPGQGEVFGYVRRQFQAYTFPIKRFAGSGNRTIELTISGGFPGSPSDRNNVGPRVRFRNMAATLDQAREWYFDARDNRLYIFPPGGNLGSQDNLVVWGGEGTINCSGANNIYFHNFVIQNFCTSNPQTNRFGSVVSFDRGSRLRLRGCTLRHIAIPLAPFSIQHQAKECLVDSCDIYDNGRGSRLRGGNITTGSVVKGRNRVSNCHFTRVDSRYLGEAMGIQGCNNTFSGNLVHNSSRQPISYFGFDNIIERNEIFNVGQDEGDGGAIYTGARLYSYGNKLRENMIHHNINVPGLLTRNGIYLDDFDAGDTVTRNLCYKAGAFGIYSNKGTGNTLNNNVVMKSFSGVRSGGGGKPAYDTAMLYLNRVGSRTPTTNIKENYVGRMLEVCGKSGWEGRVNSGNWRNEINPFWTNRYSRFGISMNRYFSNQTMIPYETRIYDNFFAGNDQNFQAPSGSSERGSKTFSFNNMVNAEGNLDFRWKSGQRPSGSINTNDFFNKIGLQAGTFRRSRPSASAYRLAVSRRFSGVAAYVQGASFNRNAPNHSIYNSGRIVIADSQRGLNVREGDASKNNGASSGGGGGAVTNAPRTTSATNTGPFVNALNYRWDFGTSSSALFSGYSRITPSTNQGYARWNTISGLNSRDRGGSQNALNRDFVFGRSTRVFQQQIANGNYRVTVNLFDANGVHDNMRVRAEGVTKLSNQTFGGSAGNTTRSFTITVSDGRLDIEFSDQGGANPDWVVNRLVITRI